LDLDAPVGRMSEGGPMTKRKIAGWIMLPVVYAAFFGVLELVLEAQEEQEMAVCCRDMPPSVTPPPERPSPSTPVEEVFKPEPVALALNLGCRALPSWRVYSTVPLVYHPPCRPGEMLRRARARKRLTKELEQARAGNTALHERLREMAAYEARMGVQ
jgi:hypothetical protein